MCRGSFEYRLLPENERLCRRRDFSAVYGRKKSWASPLLVLYVRRHDISGPNCETRRFGFSVSKKVGKAHDRNRVKRRLSEICRLHGSGWKRGFDVVVVARSGSAAATYADIEGSMRQLMIRAGLTVPEPSAVRQR